MKKSHRYSMFMNMSRIKVEPEDLIVKCESSVSDEVVTNSESLADNCEVLNLPSDEGNPHSRNLVRPSRISKASLISEANNIYAKPRMHFTGRGIMTRTQPGFSSTLKTKRERKGKLKNKIKEYPSVNFISAVDKSSPFADPSVQLRSDLEAEPSIIKDSVINSCSVAKSAETTKHVPCSTVNSESAAKVFAPSALQDTYVNNHPAPKVIDKSMCLKLNTAKKETQSIFLIKKKKERKFAKVVQHEKSIIHPNYYIGTNKIKKHSLQETRHSELTINESESDENQSNIDSSCNYFLNQKMFRRLGPLSDGVVECTLCFKNMKDSSMKQHFKTHSGAKPFSCNVCKARFTRKGDVYRHSKTIHGSAKPFECTMCEKRFSERKSLIAHLQNHDRILYYTCSKCGFKFGKREYYENHLRFIHPLPEGQSLCDIKDVVDKGLKQLEELMVEEKNSIRENKVISDDKEEGKLPLTIQIKEEVEEFCETSNESRVDSMSPDFPSSPQSNEDLLLREREPFQDNEENMSVVKGTLRLNHRVSFKEELEAAEEEELVNKAIHAAVSQAETALENIQSTIGNNMTKSRTKYSKETCSVGKDSRINRLPKKMQPKSSEIHINAIVGGNVRKFIVQIPAGSNIDATTQDGMDALINMVNYLCSGKGELNGPVEVVMHHKI